MTGGAHLFSTAETNRNKTGLRPCFIAIVLFTSWVALSLVPSCRSNPFESGSTASTQTEAVLPLEANERAETPPGKFITDHGPPAPALFIVAGIKGYTEPCGCTAGLHIGGLDKLVGTIAQAQLDFQGESLVIDAGNMLFEEEELPPHLIDQERLKAPLIVQAHNRLGTIATTPGPYDLALGLPFYLETLEGSPVHLLSSNLLDRTDNPVGVPYMIHNVGDISLGLIGAADPALFQNSNDVVATDPVDAVRQAVAELERQETDTILLLMQGDQEATDHLVSQVEGLDFAIVGYAPQESKGASLSHETALMEIFDQGRYVGIIKLYSEGDGPYLNASPEPSEAVFQMERRIAYLQGQISLLPPYLQGQEPPIVQSMMEEIETLNNRLHVVLWEGLDLTPGNRQFLAWTVPLEPGYPVDATTSLEIDTYNAALGALHQDRTTPLPLGEEDIPYVGINVCRSCHYAAYEYWLTTPHSFAIDTLVDRDKAFDEVCVSCHVTGYRQPGGSVVGHYNDLANIQCEACHGPGGRHITAPPAHITRTPLSDTCEGCHNPEHSPHFEYERFLPLILGPGHGE